MLRSNLSAVAVLVVVAGVIVSPADGQVQAPGKGPTPGQVMPTAVIYANQLIELGGVPVVDAPPVDRETVALEDEQRILLDLPPRFAIPHPVLITPDTHGVWELVDPDTSVWRLRIISPGALSLNLGFTRYQMPEGASLFIYASDFSSMIRPLTAEDNDAHGQLWTPVLLSDDIMVELTIPTQALDNYELELISINVGYRGFGEAGGGLRSGSCNVDIICSQGDLWRVEIPAVGVISTGGSTFCTGFMVNNTAQDQTNYFMTANHCGITSSNAPSLVVYWNYYNSWCRTPGSPESGGAGDGSLSQWQNGSVWRASYSSSDFTLVRLDDTPNPAWNITYAGWDRSTADPTSAVAIHHPNTDEKRISFEYDPTSTTSYLGTAVPGDGTHIRITDWDLGTTEGGSSGSPLFDQNHHVVGQLHGGYASCTSQTSDWYGRFSKSWTGGGTSSTRLSNWLDAAGTGLASVDTLIPGAAGLQVTPSSGLSSVGEPGGPFSPDNVVYTLENLGATALNYSVTKTQSWVSVSSTSGSLAGHATTTVTVSINSGAASLGVGTYTDTVSFTNTTDHVGDTTRPVTLQVGGPRVIYSFPMDTNPGWSVQGQWAFGDPTGGGSHGFDPNTGHTGNNVYGYNLNGDYTNSMPAYYLTTTALNCSDLTDVELRFWKWLGVESST
ncbi:MAG: trypsin-like peptidase domain-containing protein, partial [Planctomycetota bacterium]